MPVMAIIIGFLKHALLTLVRFLPQRKWGLTAKKLSGAITVVMVSSSVRINPDCGVLYVRHDAANA